MMSARVVIVSRTKNRPLLLPRCLQSVLAQTFSQWLHVIVNDGGDAATVESIVARFAAAYQGRIKIIHNPTALGMQNASNLAIQATESEYLAIHDDDDTWRPLFLEACVRHLDALGPAALEQGVVTQTAWILEEIDSRGHIAELSRRDFYPLESVSLFQLAAKNLFPPIAFLYRRKVHDTIGYFDPAFNELGDHDFNLRFAARYDIGVLSSQLAGYHWRHQAHGNSYGNTVTDGVAAHRQAQTRMQNHYLRQDLARQQIGLGFLMNLAANFQNQSETIKEFYGKSERSKRALLKKLEYYDGWLTLILTPWKKKLLPWRLYDHLADSRTKTPPPDAPAQLPLVDQLDSFSGAWDGDLASSLYTDLVRRRRQEHPVESMSGKAFWEMLGYEVIGPLYHSFVAWVIDRAQRRRLDTVFFLARDGFHLVKVFELFKQKLGFNLNGEYLFASRRLLNFPRIERLDEESLAFLTTPNPAMRAVDFLARIGLNPTAHAALLHKHGFKEAQSLVTTKNGIFISEAIHQQMRQLMRALEIPLLESARLERKKLLAYFESAGLLKKACGIVDLGWQASSLRSLNDLLAGADRRAFIPGFYFGTWKFAAATVNAGCPLESFFMHLDQPPHRAAILREGVELLECFFSAPTPGITGLAQKPGGWEPVYGERETDPQMQTKLAVTTEAAFEFVRDALASLPPTGAEKPPYGYLETVLERLLKHPRADEAAALGNFSLRNSFGGSGPLRRVAQVPPAWERIARRRALQNAYDHCYWKPGFLAQLGPRAKKQLKL